MRCGVTHTEFFRAPVLMRLLGQGIFILALAATTVFGEVDIQQVNGDSFRSLIRQGDKLVRKGEYSEAEKLFKRAHEMDPSHSGAKLKLAFVNLKQRRLLQAYDLSLSVAQAEPKNPTAFAVLGATLLSAGKFREARAVFFNSLRLNRKEALAWAGYGMLDFYENRILDSLSNLHQAVFHNPEEPDYLFALAQVSARAERYKDAADAYNRFLTISRNTDDERRQRIKGIIAYLPNLAQKRSH